MRRRVPALLLAAVLALSGLGVAAAPPAAATPANSVPNDYNVCWVVNPNRTPNGYSIHRATSFSFTDSVPHIWHYVQCSFTPNRLDLPNYGNGCTLVRFDMQGDEPPVASPFTPSPNLDYPLICPAKGA